MEIFFKKGLGKFFFAAKQMCHTDKSFETRAKVKTGD